MSSTPLANDAAARLFSPLQLALVVALHAAVWTALLASDAVAVRPRPATLLVHMIAPEPRPVAPAPVAEPQPTAAKPVATRSPSLPPPPLANRATAPAGTNAPAPESAPAMAAGTPAPAAEAATAAAPPAPLIEPRVDANYLDNPAPTYPPVARRLGEEGKVMLRVFVEADGRPASVEVKSGSGSPRLDAAALEAVRRWKFVPARRGAEAVGAWVLVPIAFHLKG